MIRLHKFLEKITPEYNVNYVNYVDSELKKINVDLVNDSFCNAIEFCMLKAYSFDESLDMIINIDFNYDYLSLVLDFSQAQKPIEPINWTEFLSKFPKPEILVIEKPKAKGWERPYKYHR